MSFLAPLTGLFAGVLGITGLLLLHALKLRRRPVRVSSTLLWMNAAKDLEVNIPFRAPRMTLLFLLQLLAVILLALALARPVVGAAERIPGRLIVVIDASASMNAADAGPEGMTRLERAKALAVDRLGSMRRGSAVPEIAVVRASLDPRMVVAPRRSIENAIAGIRTIEPTDQPLDLDNLRAMLNALLDHAAEEDEESAASTEPTVWIFTDAGMIRPSDFPGWSGEIVTVTDAPGRNAGIAAMHAIRDPSEPDTARVFLRVVSNADRPAGVVVRLRAGVVTQTVPLEIPAATEEGPGAVTRAVTIRAPGAARLEASLESGGGVLASDDRAWADLPDPRPPRTVVFAPDGRPDPFLLDVLGVLAPGSVSSHAPTERDALAGAELVVYDRVTPDALPSVPSLGFASAWPGAEEQALREGRERIVVWDRAHPVLRDLSLATVVFDRAVPLPDESAPGVTVLAEARSGPAIIEAVGGGVRHIRVSFPLTRSNWAMDVGMPIFIASAFERLAPGVRGEGVVHTTSESIEIRAAADRVRADGPLTAEAPASEGVAILGPLARAGVYTLTGAEQPTLAVSMLDAGESAIRVGEPALFGREALPAARAAVEGRRELWPTLLLIAFVIMTLEWFVHARRARI
ncbi:MAG: VWA domain-containing protein [Phycisphaerales bacterium]|nr:VWA domain-containing protein [Planctomycetota bacterium]MCH8509174.1 VWA domain-containing protein [Phycisphaerales bacterium]